MDSFDRYRKFPIKDLREGEEMRRRKGGREREREEERVGKLDGGRSEDEKKRVGSKRQGGRNGGIGEESEQGG